MKVRVLGCSGGVNRNVATTSFMVDEDLLIDAGSGVCNLSLEQMNRIQHIFITHSHLDHIAAIPLMADTLFDQLKQKPMVVHGLPETLAALKKHVFNWEIWPDFTALPDAEHAAVKLEPMLPGETVEIEGRIIEMVAVNHTVPGAAYLVKHMGRCFAFSGDTTTNDSFWQALNAQPSVDLLVVETAFTNEDQTLADLARHYCPRLLAEDLKKLHHDTMICISHLKPGAEDRIMQQCIDEAPDRTFHRLDTDQVFDLG
jgi:ribonuclease BN (tRNA processing enzyme)